MVVYGVLLNPLIVFKYNIHIKLLLVLVANILLMIFWDFVYDNFAITHKIYDTGNNKEKILQSQQIMLYYC